jgi:hypothetical protein
MQELPSCDVLQRLLVRGLVGFQIGFHLLFEQTESLFSRLWRPGAGSRFPTRLRRALLGGDVLVVLDIGPYRLGDDDEDDAR